VDGLQTFGGFTPTQNGGKKHEIPIMTQQAGKY